MRGGLRPPPVPRHSTAQHTPQGPPPPIASRGAGTPPEKKTAPKSDFSTPETVRSAALKGTAPPKNGAFPPRSGTFPPENQTFPPTPTISPLPNTGPPPPQNMGPPQPRNRSFLPQKMQSSALGRALKGTAPPKMGLCHPKMGLFHPKMRCLHPNNAPPLQIGTLPLHPLLKTWKSPPPKSYFFAPKDAAWRPVMGAPPLKGAAPPKMGLSHPK